MEKSHMKGLMFAAGLCKTAELFALMEVLPPPPGGARGWMREWAAAARSIRDKDLIAAAQAAEQEKRAAKAAVLAELHARPIWGVLPEYGSYSFSNELFGFKVMEGKGSLTYEEAEVEAEAKRKSNARRITAAADYWDAYLNG